MDERLKPGAMLKQTGRVLLGGSLSYFQGKTQSLTTLVNDARTVKNTLIQQGEDSTKIFNNIKNNGLKQFTDWFYAETENYESSDLSQDESDFDAGFQIGGTVEEDDEDEKPVILDARAMRDIARGQAHVMYKIGGKQVEAATMNTAEIISTINDRSTEIVAAINTSNQYLKSIDERLGKMESWMGSSHAPTEDSRYENEDKFVGTDGSVGLANFVNTALPKLIDAITHNTYTGLARNYISDSATEMVSNIVHDRIGGIEIFGKSINKYLDEFNRGLENRIDQFFTTLTDLDIVQNTIGPMNQSYGNRDFSKLAKNQYTTDVAKFDGMTRQSIIEIIPGYLRRITEALTGQNFRINDKGHLTTGPVAGFQDKVSEQLRSNDINLDTMESINQSASHFSKYNLSQVDMNTAANALVAACVKWMTKTGKTTISNPVLEQIQDWIVNEAANQLSALDGNLDRWMTACQIVMTHIMRTNSDKREFAKSASRRYKYMMEDLTNYAMNSPIQEGVGRIQDSSFFAGILNDYNRQKGEGDINNRYSEQKKALKAEIAELKSQQKQLINPLNPNNHSDLKETKDKFMELQSQLSEKNQQYQQLLKSLQDELDTFNAGFESDSDSHLSTPTKSLIGASDQRLQTVNRYVTSIYRILNRGINVNVVGYGGFGDMNELIGAQNFAGHRDKPVVFDQPLPDVQPVKAVGNIMPHNESREIRTPSGSGTSTHTESSSDDGDVPITGPISSSNFMEKARSTASMLAGIASKAANAIVDHTPLKNNKFIKEHMPSNPDPTNMNVEGSDKAYFDLVRTAISAALSNGNGVEDLNDINTMINKIKNPIVRANVKRYADKMIRMNSQKADAENEKQTDPNIPPEKKPGILGGLSQLLFGGAKRFFAPVLALLTPITSLVRVIAKPLIELAKKGFKSGINDIRSGAKQIWGAIKPKGLPSFGLKKRNKDESSSDTAEEVKTTADAGEAAGVSQNQSQQKQTNQQQKMYPLAPATQSYHTTQGMNATNTSTTTAAGTGWSNNAQTFSWDGTVPPQVSTNNNVQQPEYKLKDPLAPATKTEATEGSATGTKKESETSKNTKATGKLASVLGGVASIGQGLLKIALTIIGSLTAVKSAVDLVIRVLKRSVQPLNKGIKRLINSIKPVIKSLGKLVGQLAGFVTKLVDTLMGVIQPLMEILTPVIDAIMVALEPLMQGIDKIVQVAVDIVTPLMPVVQLLLDNATTTLNMMTNMIDEIITPFTEAIQPIIEDLGEMFGPWMVEMREAILPIRDMFSTLAIDVIGPLAGSVMNGLIPIVQDIANIIKLGFSTTEITIGSIQTWLGQAMSWGGQILSAISDGKFGTKMVNAGEQMRQSGEDTVKAGQQNYNDAILYFLQKFHLVEKKEEPKKEVEVPEKTTQSNETFHGSIMEGLTGSGDPHDQHSYGGFLNMSDHGCGPIALADMAARRGGGTINAANLALSMANSGAYGINDGTSIGGFMDTAASMGMGTKLGGVTASSLGMASPDNPITIIGSGYGFGTRNGNNHYLNVIGTNGAGGAYVSNPLTGRIEVHSAAGLASSALAGIYGSGDTPPSADTAKTSSSVNLSDQIQEIHDATDGLTSIGGNATTTASIDLGSAVEDALADLKEITSKILGIFNFDGTFESNLKKSVSKTEDDAIISNIHASMTDAEYENYVSQARALFQQENPKKLFESDKKYEQRFQENLATYLSKVASDDVKTKQVELLSKSYNTQTKNIEKMYGKYDPESDSYIDEDKGSIVAMVSDTVNSKIGTGLIQALLSLVSNGVLGNLTDGIVGGIADAITGGIGGSSGGSGSSGSNGGNPSTKSNGGSGSGNSGIGSSIGGAIGSIIGTAIPGGSIIGGGIGSSIGDAIENAFGGDNYFSNAIDDANNAGRMVSTGGVRLGGANYYPSITVANVQGNSSSTMTQTPIHEFLSRAAGQSYAWSVDGNWYSKRNTPDTTGQGSTSSSHSGVDILMPDRQSNNVPLYATTDGTVVGIRSGVTGPDHNNNTAGNAVYWTDAAGYKHRFLHMSNTTPLVREGQQIYGGQTLLGYMGNTGDSYGHHLHYDISTPGGQTVNPMTYFQFATGSPQSNSTYGDPDMDLSGNYEDTDLGYSYGDLVNSLNLVGVTGYNEYDNYSGGYSGGHSNGSSYSYTPNNNYSGGGGNYTPSTGNSGSSSGSSGSSNGSSTKTTKSTGNSGSLTSKLPGVKSANAVESNISDKYSNSGLVKDGMDYRSQFQYKSGERTHDIDTVTWHVWAGSGDMNSFLPNMTSSARSMSPTYAIDTYGNIAQFVDEGRRPWTSGDSTKVNGKYINTNGGKNDNRAITFEIANVNGITPTNPKVKGYDEEWPITPESLQSALDLTVDVARRNGINYFYYTGADYHGHNYYGENGRFASPGNFTYHNQFANKSCPGEYIVNRTDEIIKTLNDRISQGRGAAIAGLDQTIIEKAYAGEASTLDKDIQSIIDKYTIRRYANDAWEAQSNAAHNNMITQAEKRVLAENGIDTKTLYNPSNYTSTGTGNSSSTKLNPSAGQKTLDMLSGISSSGSGSKIDIGGVASDYTGVWNQYLNKFGADKISNYFETAQKAGLSTAEAALVAAIGIYEDSGQKIFGNKSLTNVTYDKYGQAAFGIMNWVPSEKTANYGSTLEEQLRTIYNLYLSPDATHSRATIQSNNYNAYKNALETALGHSLQLQPGQNWADIADEDIMEAMGHLVGNALVPESYAWTSGQAKHTALAGEIYNWMVDNGYSTSVGIGTSSTDPYKNMGYYLKYLKTGDLSYLDNVTGDMYSIANDLIRYGNYFYNAGGGKSDYNIATAMKDFSSVFQQPDTMNGWVYQDGAGSQAFYYQNGDIIGEGHMGPSGTYEVNWYEDRSDENTLVIKGGKVQYQQPSQPKKPGKTASTNNDGTAKPASTQSNNGDSSKPTKESNNDSNKDSKEAKTPVISTQPTKPPSFIESLKHTTKDISNSETIGGSIKAYENHKEELKESALNTTWSDVGKTAIAGLGLLNQAALIGPVSLFTSGALFNAGSKALHALNDRGAGLKGRTSTGTITSGDNKNPTTKQVDEAAYWPWSPDSKQVNEAEYWPWSPDSKQVNEAAYWPWSPDSKQVNEAAYWPWSPDSKTNNKSSVNAIDYLQDTISSIKQSIASIKAKESLKTLPQVNEAEYWPWSPDSKREDTNAMIGDSRFSLSAKEKSKLYDEAKARYDAAVKAYNNASGTDRNAYIREMHAAQADMTKYKAYEGLVSKYEDSRKREIGNTGIYINNRNDNENRNPIKDRDALSKTDPRFTKLDLTGYPEQMILESHTVSRDKDKDTNKALAVYSEMAVPNIQQQINELTNKNSSVFTPAPSFDTPKSVKQAQSLIQTLNKIDNFGYTIASGYDNTVNSKPYRNFIDKSADFNFGMFNELQETGGKVYDLDDKIGALTGKTVVDANKAFTVWSDNNSKKIAEQAGRLISAVDSTSSKLKNAYPNFIDKSADFNFGMFNELQETGGNIYDLTYKMAGVDSRGIDSRMAAEYAKHYNGEYSTPEAADAFSKGVSSTNSAFNSAFTAFDTGLQNSYSGIKSLAVAGGMAGSLLNSFGTTKASQSKPNGLLQGPVTKPTEYKSDAKVYEDFLKSGASSKPDSSWIYNYVDTDKKKTGMTKDYGKSSVERLRDELNTLYPRSTKTTSKTVMIPDENGYMTLVPESIADVASQIKQANAKSGKTQSDDMLSRISRAKYDMTRGSTKPSSFAKGFNSVFGSLSLFPSSSTITKLAASLFGTKKDEPPKTVGNLIANAFTKINTDIQNDPNVKVGTPGYDEMLRLKLNGVDRADLKSSSTTGIPTGLSTNLLGKKHSLSDRISKYTADQKSTLFQNYIYGKEMTTGTKLTAAQKANYAQMFNNSIMPDDFEDYIVEVSHGGRSSYLGANTLDDIQTVSRPTASAKLSDYLTNKQSARDKKVTKYTAAQKSARLNDYITGYELTTGTKLTAAQKANYAQIINAGGTPEDFKRYTNAVKNAEQTKLAQQQAQQFVNSMPKSTISSGNTEYGTSWTEHYAGYKPNDNSSIYTSISTSDTSNSYNGTWYDDGSWGYNGGASSVTRDSNGDVWYHFGSDTSDSEKASVAYTATKEYQNSKQTSTSKQAKLTNAAAKSGSTKASEQASIAYQKTMEMKKKKGKGDAPDTTPSTLTNVDIPALDLNRLLTPDRTTSMPTPSTYTTTYNSSNSNLNKILNNTFNVRAKRVEELLESIDKKLESFSKNNNGNRPPTSPTRSTSNPFPDNGIPTQIDKLALG